MVLELRNPHSVLAALTERPGDVLAVRLHGRRPRGVWAEVVETAERIGVPVQRGVGREPGGRQRRRSPREGTERTGAAQAAVKERKPADLHELLRDAQQGRGRRRLWLALDQLQDPHNVGAVFRTAAFFGVEGIAVSRDRSAPLNATVYDVAAGGMEYVPFSVEPNLVRALQTAKKAGLWILGSSEHAETDFREIPADRPWLLVVGNEEKGLRQLTLKNCDMLCRISPRGAVGSLNVSVAAGILIAALTVNGNQKTG